ncbi:MAG TPA: hypothetical protein VJQ47_04225 [Steroidobacteraceae bacterium]|nr:hypothetical protein [Steroidobacteraceae bacterium]
MTQVTGVARSIPLKSGMAPEVREVVTQIATTYRSGLAERARVVGYHREVMVLQTGGPHGEFLNVYLDFNDVSDIGKAGARIAEYGTKTPTPFTQYWSGRFASMSSEPNARSEVVETLVSWEDDGADQSRREPSMMCCPIQQSKLGTLQLLLKDLHAAERWEGWVQRARAVGCYKELLCVQHAIHGPRLVVYREGRDAELGRRLTEYDKSATDFSRWWYPHWNALLEGGSTWSATERYEKLLDWTDEQRRTA